VSDFDYIIAGAGAAGLNLAHAMIRAGLGDRRILLADRAPKTTNDRTWCFWEHGDNALEPVIHRRWHKLAFHSEGLSKLLNPAPYVYKMLRGVDFYQHMDAWLAEQPNITRVYGEISALDSTPDSASITIDGVTHHARFAFSSLPQPELPRDPNHHYLLQHFLGWIIETEEPSFDPSVATLMDFRIAQQGETRFVYTLPLDERRALVEFTVFSRGLLPRHVYSAELRAYIEHRLGVDEYKIEHDEFGVIPMTDAPVERRPAARVMTIGTAGGVTKPSTGYTFLRTQRDAARIAGAIKAGREPHDAINADPARFKLFDSTLLNVLDGRQGGARVFADMFRRNPSARILRFLDEESSLLDDLQIMASVDIPVFTRAMAAVLARGA
jgi:lycopene beta-cyclase